MPCNKKVVFNDSFSKIKLTNDHKLPTENSISQSQWFLLNEIDSFSGNEGSLVCQELAKSWEFMPNSQPPYQINIPKDKEIIFFGGSFNPWHEGHESCLTLLNKPDKLFIIPDNNPRKQSQEVTCAWKRYQDLKRLIPFDYPIYSGFWSSNQSNPTASWLPQIKDQYPDLQLSLLMGYDSFITIHDWIDAPKLLDSLSKIYIASRLDDLELRNQQYQKLTEQYQVELIFLGNHPHEEVSSTKIRAQKDHKSHDTSS